MADIHIYTEGEPLVYPEAAVADLLKSGQLLPEMLFWREGMAKWDRLSNFQITPSEPPPQSPPEPPPEPSPELPSQPLHETIAPPRRTQALPDLSAGHVTQTEPAAHPVVDPLDSDSQHIVGRQRFRFRKSPEPLTTILQVLLIICICVAALELANAIVHYEAMTSGVSSLTAPDGNSIIGDAPTATPDATSPAPDVADDTGWMLEETGWVVNVLLIVPYFMWLYRANQNCRHFSTIMRFKPKWAVGCYFVPPMNVFRPCQVMQEIWRVSNNPRTWHNDRGSVLVGFWWGLTLATVVLSVFNFVQSLEAATHDDQVQVEQVFLALKVLQLAAYGTFIAMVTIVIQKQRSVVQKSKRRADVEEAAGKA